MSDQPPPIPPTSVLPPKSGHPLLRGTANLFLLTFFCDGFLTLLAPVLGNSTFHSSLSILSGFLSLIYTTLAIVLVFQIGNYRQLPWRVLAPALLLALWGGSFFIPLPVILPWRMMMLLAGCFELFAGGAALACNRKKYGTWLLPESAYLNTTHSWWRSLKATFIKLFILFPVFLVWLGLTFSWMLHYASNGFMHLKLRGVSTESRTYQKGGKKVFLLPTAHIASGEFYKQLIIGIPTENAVTLPEGVSDRLGIMKARLTYQGAAKSAGLAEQPDFRNELPTSNRRVDVDVSDFSKPTQELLNTVSKGFERWANDDMLGAYAAWTTAQEVDYQQLRKDILDLRNAKVSEGILSVLPEFDNVIIPWGAAHMPGIEKELLKAQFKQISSREVLVFEWDKILDALLKKLSPKSVLEQLDH